MTVLTLQNNQKQVILSSFKAWNINCRLANKSTQLLTRNIKWEVGRWKLEVGTSTLREPQCPFSNLWLLEFRSQNLEFRIFEKTEY